MENFFSVVITSFNRKNIIKKSIDSVLNQSQFEILSDLIIVDDASTDDSVSFIRNEYRNEINSKKIKVVALEENMGVSGAKNVGYIHSKSKWVIFLDSDDLLIDNSLMKLKEECMSTLYPLVFFRCIDQNDNFVGRKFESNKIITIAEYIENTSYGEALTAIKKNIIFDEPYITELRGYEGLGCSRIIEKYDGALLSTIIARIYYQEGEDRLSAKRGFLNRLLLLSKGHFFMIKEFRKYMSIKLKMKFFTKIIVYFIVGNINKVIKESKK